MNLIAIVVAKNGQLRNKNIIDFFLTNKIRHYIVQGVDGTLFDNDDFQLNGLFNHDKFQSKHLSSISSGEISCAIGHKTAYDLLLNLKEEIPTAYLILEDDAEIETTNFKTILETATIIESLDAPSVVLLYSNSYICARSPSFLVTDRRFVIHKCYIDPSSTVAYFINQAALNMSIRVKYPLTDRADWPESFSTLIDFYSYIPDLVNTGNYDSEIEVIERRVPPKVMAVIFKKIFKIKKYNSIILYFNKELKGPLLLILHYLKIIKIKIKGY